MDMFIKKSIIPLVLVSATAFSVYTIATASAQHNGVDQQKNVDIGSKIETLNYDHTALKIKDKELLIYTDNDENEYAMKNNEIVGFFQNKKVTDKSNTPFVISQKRSLDSVLSSPLLSKINIDDYQLESSDYVASYNETTFVFSKYINDIKTNDGVYIAINDDDSLSSFSAPRQGLFDNLVTDITAKDVTKFIEEKLNSDFSGVKYDIDNMYIDYVDGKYVVVSLVSLYYNDYNDSVTLLYNL